MEEENELPKLPKLKREQKVDAPQEENSEELPTLPKLKKKVNSEDLLQRSDTSSGEDVASAESEFGIKPLSEQLNPLNDNQAVKQPEKEKESNPLVTLWNKGEQTLVYTMPASMVASGATVLGATEDLVRSPGQAMAKAGAMPVNYSLEAKKEIDDIDVRLNRMLELAMRSDGKKEWSDQKKEDIATLIEQATSRKNFLRRYNPDFQDKAAIRQWQKGLLTWAIDHQAKGSKLSTNLVNNLSDINDPVDAINWFVGAVAESAPQIVGTALTGGLSGASQSIGSTYMRQVENVAREKGLTVQEVIDRDLDSPASGLVFGTLQGVLENLGAKGVLNVSKNELTRSLRRRSLQYWKEKGISTVKAAKGEAATEGAQTGLEQVGAGENIQLGEIGEASAKGAAGGTFTHAVGSQQVEGSDLGLTNNIERARKIIGVDGKPEYYDHEASKAISKEAALERIAKGELNGLEVANDKDTEIAFQQALDTQALRAKESLQENQINTQPETPAPSKDLPSEQIRTEETKSETKEETTSVSETKEAEETKPITSDIVNKTGDIVQNNEQTEDVQKSEMFTEDEQAQTSEQPLSNKERSKEVAHWRDVVKKYDDLQNERPLTKDEQQERYYAESKIEELYAKPVVKQQEENIANRDTQYLPEEVDLTTGEVEKSKYYKRMISDDLIGEKVEPMDGNYEVRSRDKAHALADDIYNQAEKESDVETLFGEYVGNFERVPDMVRAKLGENLLDHYAVEGDDTKFKQVYDVLQKNKTRIAQELNSNNTGRSEVKERVTDIIAEQIEDKITKLKPENEAELKELHKELKVTKEEVSQLKAEIRKMLEESVKRRSDSKQQEIGMHDRIASRKAKVANVKNKLNSLKIGTKGQANSFTHVLGAKAWNAGIDAINAALDAGVSAANAIDRAILEINKLYTGAWDTDAFKAFMATELEGIEGIDQIETAYRYTPPIVLKEREDAAKRLRNKLLGDGKTSTGQKQSKTPAIEEFYNRLVSKMVSMPREGKPALKKEDAINEVLKNLDKYRDVLIDLKNTLEQEGIDTKDVQDVFDLPFFQKDTKKAVIKNIDIEKLIDSHYTKTEKAGKSFADKLIDELNLDQKTAERMEEEIHQALTSIVKDRQMKVLAKRLGSVKLPITKRAKRKSLMEQVVSDINRGALNDSMFTDLFADFYGFKKLTPRAKQTMLKYVDRLEKLSPYPEMYNRVANEFWNQLKKDGADKFTTSQVFVDLLYHGALSGMSTLARTFKGSLLTQFSSMAMTSAASIHKPLAVGRAWGEFFKGIPEGGKTAWDIISTGFNPDDFVDHQPRGDSYITSKVNARTRDIAKRKDAFGMFIKGMFTIPVYMIRSYRAWDALMKAGSKRFHGFMIEYNKDFEGAADEAYRIYSSGVEDQLQQQADEDIETLKEMGEKIPVGFRDRRISELREHLHEETVRKRLNYRASEAVLMADPHGFAGYVYRGMQRLLTENKDDNKAVAIAKMFGRSSFLIMRVPANFLNQTIDYSPLGILRGRTLWLRGNESYKLTPEERRIQFIKAATGTIVSGVIANMLFDWDEERKELVLSKDSPIEVYGRGLAKYKDNESIAPDWKPYSIRVKGSDGKWSGFYSFIDNPLGGVLAPLGDLSDVSRFKDFQDDVDAITKPQMEKERKDMEFYASAFANGTIGYMMSQSYQQGIRDLRDVFLPAKDDYTSAFGKLGAMATRPVKTITVPNFYQQAYNAYKAFSDTPEKYAKGTFDRMVKGTPLIESHLLNDDVDIFGYPVVKKREIPLVFDEIVLDVVENINLREGMKEWELIYKHPQVIVSPFRAPKHLAYGNLFKDEYDLEYKKIAGEEFREYINKNYEMLDSLPAEKLQFYLDKLKQAAGKKAWAEISRKYKPSDKSHWNEKYLEEKGN